MVHLQLIALQNDGSAVSERILGEIRADSDQLRIEPADVISPTLQVVSLRDGTPLTGHANAEEWARSLSGSLRGVGMTVRVIEDSDPIDEPQDEEPDFEVPEHAPNRSAAAR
jgi:hypothetical protein